MVDVKKLIGKRIKQRREQLGLSQVSLANAAKKESATYIALIESGERYANPSDLLLIAKALSVPVGSLMGENPMPTADARYALKNDGDLSPEDRNTLIRLIDTMKKSRKEK